MSRSPTLRWLAPLMPLTIAVIIVAFATAQNPFEIPLWAYPGGQPGSAPADSAKLHQVPNSTARFTLREILDRFAPPDWHPRRHPPMPDVVAHGRAPKLFACAYCHLPNGTGRPENAVLAGLPEAYIVAQLEAFRSSARKSPLPAYIPGLSMHTVAVNATDQDAVAAARYFSRLKNPPKVRVIEVSRIPRVREAAFVYARDPAGGTDSLGTRIIEGPPELERHELRDDEITYVAYVPPGSVRRGRSIAMTGPAGPPTACVKCHGPRLQGVALVPPLAGHFPTYIMRQLVAFRTGARSTPASQPMQAVVARMSVDDMIAVSAYAGSLNAASQHQRR
ncbi:MAG TPA: c-type cytochrome [Burkholderiales bacterium]|nr:c-type cytochrome [Burkholderiales bacterium]